MNIEFPTRVYARDDDVENSTDFPQPSQISLNMPRALSQTTLVTIVGHLRSKELKYLLSQLGLDFHGEQNKMRPRLVRYLDESAPHRAVLETLLSQ